MTTNTDTTSQETGAAADDIVVVLTKQHKEAKAGLEEVASLSGAAQQAALKKLAPTLEAHEHAEETVVYPRISALGADAVKVVEARETEEAKGATMLKELVSDDMCDGFSEKVNEFKDAVLTHATNEENEVFPLLNSLPADERQQLGAEFQAHTKPS